MGSGIYNSAEETVLSACVFTECCQIVPPNSFIDGGGNIYDAWCDSCRADVNCLDGVDGSDMNLLLAAWGTSKEIYDLDDDGYVDGMDLTIVLAYWGPCP
jgi:hypothetical protein